MTPSWHSSRHHVLWVFTAAVSRTQLLKHYFSPPVRLGTGLSQSSEDQMLPTLRATAKRSCLALTEKIWQMFLWLCLLTQFCCYHIKWEETKDLRSHSAQFPPPKKQCDTTVVMWQPSQTDPGQYWFNVPAVVEQLKKRNLAKTFIKLSPLY